MLQIFVYNKQLFPMYQKLPTFTLYLRYPAIFYLDVVVLGAPRYDKCQYIIHK